MNPCISRSQSFMLIMRRFLPLKATTYLPAFIFIELLPYSIIPLLPSKTTSRFEVSSMCTAPRCAISIEPHFGSFLFPGFLLIISPRSAPMSHFMLAKIKKSPSAYILTGDAMKYRVISKTAAGLTVLLTVMVMAALLIFSADAASGVSAGLRGAAELLVPSLFPFMAVSAFVIRSGAADSIGALLSPVTRRIFRLPASCAAAIFLSFAGGFPVGAKCVRLLYERGSINARQAEQMMSFCVCSGPAFLITGVGTLLLHNTSLGVTLYFSQLISGIIIGIAAGFIYGRGDISGQTKLPVKDETPEIRPDTKSAGLTGAFISSVTDAAGSVISLTAMVAIFGGFIRVCDASGVNGSISTALRFLGADIPFADNFFYILTEVTRASSSIAEGGCPLWLFAFAVGFGGLCVHFQIFAVLGDTGISRLRFFMFRLMNAFLSSVIVYIVCSADQQAVSASVTLNGTMVEYSSANIWGAAALIIMSVLFVLTLRVKSLRK